MKFVSLETRRFRGSLIIFILMIDAIISSETTVVTQRNIQEDGIFHTLRLDNLKSYIALTSWAL
jgi:hypothetical protein